MKVGIFVNTPAQFHFFRPFIGLMRGRGHDPIVLARYHPETKRLLEESGLEHIRYATPAAGKWGKLAQLPRDIASARRLLKRHKVDIVTGFGVYDVLSAYSLGIPSVCFTDTEARYHGIGLRAQYATFARLATAIVTPAWFGETMGRRHVRVRAFKEVAYLHPDRFSPNMDPQGLGGLVLEEPFAFLRLSAHGALHDAGHQGLEGPTLLRLLAALEKHMRVWVSFEGNAPPGLERYRAPIEKRRIHDVLYHAALVVGDSGSIPAEAALLGTPSLRFTTRPAELEMGGFRELERAGFLETFRDAEELVQRTHAFPQKPAARDERRALAQAYLRSLDDPLKVLADRIEAEANRCAAKSR
ncbi:MAG: hypothetical protein WC876_08375 [Candidatus Thermoplasmatota archaeon]|jgi:hypothetical protein